MSLCSTCRSIDIQSILEQEHAHPFPHHRDIIALKQSAKSCVLCKLIVETLPFDKNDELEVPPNISNDDLPPTGTGVWYIGYRATEYIHAPSTLHGIDFNWWGRQAILSLYANEDSPAALSKDVSGCQVKNAEDINLASRWLKDCIQNHQNCKFKPLRHVVPTRLINVGSIKGGQEPFLCSPKQDDCSYVSLSHCWGGLGVIRTTTSTLKGHLRVVPMQELPKTFHDAIIITRNLGIQYLWIDLLCIIQDDTEDWERESAKMAGIYMNSIVTIAASSSSNSQSGCFSVHPSYPVVPLEYYSSRGRLAGQVFLTKMRKIFDEAVNSGPLNKRAWVCQERFLSRRILHYTEEQIHWECQEVTLSENGVTVHRNARLKSNSSLGRNTLSAVDSHTGSLYWDWYEMLSDYTRRGLTNPEDKLPALSGLAYNFSVQTRDRYVAGLWKAHLTDGLLWQAARSDNAYLSRPEKYRAPSWSWASLDGCISYFNLATRNILIPTYRDAQVDVFPSGLDPYGKLKQGSLTLTTQLKEIQLDMYEVPVSFSTAHSSFTPVFHQFWQGDKFVGIAWFDEKPWTATTPLYSASITSSHVLFLEAVDDDQTYRRVGVGEMYTLKEDTSKVSWLDDGLYFNDLRDIHGSY
ncbi:MAG: hypothetical protein M1834_000973 [Cirrosporium novae-zelandiae]|nr:MAG: hypothetical protein M1834_000973 [Cirrosporium novae-zelandiae]